AGAAALLRDRGGPRRVRAGRAGGEPRGPAHQDRGEPRPSREPGGHRRVRAGPRARPLRPGPIADPQVLRRGADLDPVPDRAARGPREAEGQARGRRVGDGGSGGAGEPPQLNRGGGLTPTPRDDKPVMNRLYVVEGSPTLTGAVADHRLAIKSSEIEGFARAVAAGLGLPVEGG